ncbi:hypothetical protein V6N13_133893 [Hibiscus sabdariffa]
MKGTPQTEPSAPLEYPCTPPIGPLEHASLLFRFDHEPSDTITV